MARKWKWTNTLRRSSRRLTDDVATAADVCSGLEAGVQSSHRRGLRCVALGRKSWLFCGSDRGGRRAADMYGLIVTCKMNGVDPQAWLAEVLARIAGHPAHRLEELLPWNWRRQLQAMAPLAA
jgi:IS66 C-terminal element